MEIKNVEVAIMTVGGRETLTHQIMSKLHVPAALFLDEDRHGSLWNMERIMRQFLKTKKDGLLILQDDCALPSWFEREFSLSIIPESAMTFFMGMSSEPKELYDAGYSYAKTQNIWGQANYYPRQFVLDYLKWSKDQHPYTKKGDRAIKGVRKYSGDDTSICMYLRQAKQYSLMTLPHLVNHLEVKSSLGHPMTVRGVRRVSSVFGWSFLRKWDKDKIGKLSR